METEAPQSMTSGIDLPNVMTLDYSYTPQTRDSEAMSFPGLGVCALARARAFILVRVCVRVRLCA